MKINNKNNAARLEKIAQNCAAKFLAAVKKGSYLERPSKIESEALLNRRSTPTVNEICELAESNNFLLLFQLESEREIVQIKIDPAQRTVSQISKTIADCCGWIEPLQIDATTQSDNWDEEEQEDDEQDDRDENPIPGHEDEDGNYDDGAVDGSGWGERDDDSREEEEDDEGDDDDDDDDDDDEDNDDGYGDDYGDGDSDDDYDDGDDGRYDDDDDDDEDNREPDIDEPENEDEEDDFYSSSSELDEDDNAWALSRIIEMVDNEDLRISISPTPRGEVKSVPAETFTLVTVHPPRSLKTMLRRYSWWSRRHLESSSAAHAPQVVAIQ